VQKAAERMRSFSVEGGSWLFSLPPSPPPPAQGGVSMLSIALSCFHVY